MQNLNTVMTNKTLSETVCIAELIGTNSFLITGMYHLTKVMVKVIVPYKTKPPLNSFKDS